jgi:hypothetical protein
MSKANETKAAAKAIMDLIPPDTTEAVLASVKRQVSMRLNKLRAEALETKPRTCVSLTEFDRIMALYVPRYEAPVGALPPGQMLAASRILSSVNLTTELACDFAMWAATQEWFTQCPNQQRALNAVPRNILTAVRYGEYTRRSSEDVRLDIPGEVNEEA